MVLEILEVVTEYRCIITRKGRFHCIIHEAIIIVYMQIIIAISITRAWSYLLLTNSPPSRKYFPARKTRS